MIRMRILGDCSNYARRGAFRFSAIKRRGKVAPGYLRAGFPSTTVDWSAFRQSNSKRLQTQVQVLQQCQGRSPVPPI